MSTPRSKRRGRPKMIKTHIKELIEDIVPINDMFSESEQAIIDKLMTAYLTDFDEDALTINDIQDIMDIAFNKVLEFRMYRESKDSSGKLLDTSGAIDKLRKQSEKLKENLGSRRKDRVDPKRFSGFSIIDIAAAWDANKKAALDKRRDELMKEEEEVSKSEHLIGNRLDSDAPIIKTDFS